MHETDTARAMGSVMAAAQLAEKDPLRPAYHFRSPAQWMNDPTGTIFHNSWYHMFYQHNPYADEWGQLHWGHARSRDMIHWEHLPVALVPSEGEVGCWSGCSFISNSGKPLIFYTSIERPGDEFEAAEQWVAESDDDMIEWTRCPSNPVMTESLHGGEKIYDWRDPYMFRHDGSVYMIMGGNVNRRQSAGGVVVMYRARDPELLDWKYLGVIYRHPEVDVVQLDCPNLFPLGDKWVLLFSPWHGSIRYLTGEMDFEKPQFIPETFGLLDYGPDLFATNTLYDPDDRLVVWAWVRGFKERRGWQGCMSLPRTLSLGPRGELLQQPCVEVEQLRTKTTSFEDRTLEGDWLVQDLQGDTLEIECTFELVDASSFGVRLSCDPENERHSEEIHHDRDGISVAGTRILSVRKLPGEMLKFRIFQDRSVMEVFIDDGRYATTRVVYPEPGRNRVQFFSKGGKTLLKDLKIHHLKSEDIFTNWQVGE
ncbi:MAG: glycoside hydrolase family 32 protein [Verrucomicrobia bacterium]|nr:glycoside hydrolase family 32 protein [Verrucomicrobiota bacterium]